MSQGRLPHAKNRLEGQIFVWIPLQMLLGRIQGVSPNTNGRGKMRKRRVHTKPRIFATQQMPFGLRSAGATYQRSRQNIPTDISEPGQILKRALGFSQTSSRSIKLHHQNARKTQQKLNGKLASLNRFLAKSAEKSLPFFKTLKKCTKKSDFLWTEEAEAAFKQMKEHIAKLPMLTAPEEQEELIVYLAASKEAVSAVLMTEREARQMSIYFVSRALRGPEINYTAMEKLVLALVHARKRLRRYFQAHPITVITDQPIKNILSNPEVAGQVLADFIVERPEDEGQDNSAKEEEPLPARWILFTDGSSCVDGCGAGVILTDPKGMEFTYALRFQFETTNNEAEYEALIAGLRIGKSCCRNLETNGLVERANRSLGEGTKARLGKENKNWLEEISHVLWAHRIMIKSSNGDNTVLLLIRTKAFIPAKWMPRSGDRKVTVAENEKRWKINLDLDRRKAESKQQ
ncbi:reverse transcriptase domain-containing protein [Tanacetum coccineum]